MKNEMEILNETIQDKDKEKKKMRDSIKMSETIKEINDVNKYMHLYEREKEEKEKVIQHSKLLAQSLKDLLYQKEVVLPQAPLSSLIVNLNKDNISNIDQNELPSKVDPNNKGILISSNDKYIQKEKELNEMKLKLLNIEKQYESLSLTLKEKNSLIDSLEKSKGETYKNYLSLKEDYKKVINSNDHQYQNQSLEFKAKNEELQKLLLKLKAENDSIKKELKDNQSSMIKDKEAEKREIDILQRRIHDLNQLLSKKDKETLLITQRLNDKEKEAIDKEKKFKGLLSSFSSTVDNNKGVLIDINIFNTELEEKDKEIHNLQDIINSNQKESLIEQTELNDKLIEAYKMLQNKNKEKEELKGKLKQIEEEKKIEINENNKLRKLISTSLNNNLNNKAKDQDTISHNKKCMINIEADNKVKESTIKEISTILEKTSEESNRVIFNLNQLSIVNFELILLSGNERNSQLKEENNQSMNNEILNKETDDFRKQNGELKYKIVESEKQTDIKGFITTHNTNSSNKQIPQSISRKTQLEQNYASAKELINSLKRNNEETNKLLKETLIENKQLKANLSNSNADDNTQYYLINAIAQFKFLITDLVQKYSPHLITFNFTSTSTETNESQNEEKYYELIKKFNEDLGKTEDKYRKYKEMMKKMSRIIQNNQKEQQAQFAMQTDLLNKISNREEEFNEYKKKIKTIIGNGNTNNKYINNSIPFEKYEQILQIFSIEEEKYKKDIELLKQENIKIKKAIMNQSNIQMSGNSSFISDNNKTDSPNESLNEKEIHYDDSRSINRGYYNADLIEKKFDEDEKLFKEQLEFIKEELKITKQELDKYKSIKMGNKKNSR